MMVVREWRPGYGPEPTKIRKRPTWQRRNAWHRVWCPRPECANAEGYLVYAPLARDGAEPPERYQCAVCGAEMKQDRIRAAGP